MDPAAPLESPEDRTWPWVKRRRAARPWGQGWERFTPDKTSSPNVRKPQSPKEGNPGGKDRSPEAQRAETFPGLDEARKHLQICGSCGEAGDDD